MIDIASLDRKTDHFIFRTDEPARIEVSMVDGNIIAHAYKGATNDQDQEPDLIYDGTTPPPHPIEIGQALRDDVDGMQGTVVAWGYFTDFHLSVFLLLDEEHRVPSVQNYLLCRLDLEVYEHGNTALTERQVFGNLVEATRVWEDEYGMDF